MVSHEPGELPFSVRALNSMWTTPRVPQRLEKAKSAVEASKQASIVHFRDMHSAVVHHNAFTETETRKGKQSCLCWPDCASRGHFGVPCCRLSYFAY